MPKQVYDQYQSELRQGKAKPWYDFSDLPVWGGTLPGTPEDAAYISTELAKDISPVIGPYRSGVRSTQEYNKMMSLLDEGDYTGAISPGIWSLLESADTSLSALPLVGGILAAPIDLARAVKPIFTSPAQKAVSEVGKDALPAQQWMKQLEGRGVKKDELEWTGLQDFLKGRKGNIPKTEVEDFIEANKIDVQEVVKGALSESDKSVMFNKHLQDLEVELRTMDEEDLVDYLSNNVDEMGYDSNVLDDIRTQDSVGIDSGGTVVKLGGKFTSRKIDKEEVIDEILGLQENYFVEYPNEALMTLGVESSGKAAKFDDPNYSLPGGENYRELVLTLPSKNFNRVDNRAYGDYLRRMEEKYGDDYPANMTQTEDLELKELAEAHTGDQRNFTGGHYSEPNVLAHIRFNERVDPDGNKVLFIEEIQSDWAQKGRKHGFQDPKRKERFVVEEAVGEEGEIYYNIINTDDGLPVEVEMLREHAEETAAQFNAGETMAFFEGEKAQRVLRAPFLEDTNQWANLSLKRMIRWAADNDFDSIAWTTGKQQAERYDLSKQLDELAYRPEGDGYHLQGLKDGQKIFDKTVKESELSDTVGKELSEKIIKAEGKKVRGVTGTYSFSGIDLKVGGEGMAGFYDDIVVNQARKIGKKHGAKVEKGHADAELSRRQITKMEGEGWDGEYVLTKATTPEERWMQFDTFEEAQEYLLKTDPLDDEAGKVWKMKLTDKLKKAAKEGLPYYALVPPSLLAIGAQQERQSLLE